MRAKQKTGAWSARFHDFFPRCFIVNPCGYYCLFTRQCCDRSIKQSVDVIRVVNAHALIFFFNEHEVPQCSSIGFGVLTYYRSICCIIPHALGNEKSAKFGKLFFHFGLQTIDVEVLGIGMAFLAGCDGRQESVVVVLAKVASHTTIFGH